MAHKLKPLIPAILFAALPILAEAGQPGRSPAVTGPAIVADSPNPSAVFKAQASQVIGNSIDQKLTVNAAANPAVNREAPTPKREPAVATMSQPSGQPSMDIK